MLYTNIPSHIIGDLCYHIGYFVRWGGGNVGRGVLSGGVIVGGECWGENVGGRKCLGRKYLGEMFGGDNVRGEMSGGKISGGNYSGGGEKCQREGEISGKGKNAHGNMSGGGDTKNTCISSLHLTLDIIQLLIPMLKDLYYNPITSITKKIYYFTCFFKDFHLTIIMTQLTTIIMRHQALRLLMTRRE